MISAWIPKRYDNASLSELKPTQKHIIGNLNKTGDLIIQGAIGTGKTYIGCAYANFLIQKEVSARYITEYEFTGLFTHRHSSDTGTAREAEIKINNCKSCHTLIIDEVGKRKLTDNQQVELDELISDRYNNMKRTIFITNLTGEEFKLRIGDRAYDRLRDNEAELITITGKSLRGEAWH